MFSHLRESDNYDTDLFSKLQTKPFFVIENVNHALVTLSHPH